MREQAKYDKKIESTSKRCCDVATDSTNFTLRTKADVSVI